MEIENEENSIEPINKEKDLQPFTPYELNSADKYDPDIDYRQELIDRYKDSEENFEIDDSWVEDSDKISLIRFLNEIVNKNYQEYPSVMTEILAKKMYYDTVKNMNEEEYLEEKKRDNHLSVVDKELQKIKDENSLEYALKKKED